MMPLMKINEMERNQKMGIMHHNSASQQNVAIGNNSQNQQNPAAYDDLKKRLLNEYKKLVGNKKNAGNSQPTGSSSNMNSAN